MHSTAQMQKCVAICTSRAFKVFSVEPTNSGIILLIMTILRTHKLLIGLFRQIAQKQKKMSRDVDRCIPVNVCKMSVNVECSLFQCSMFLLAACMLAYLAHTQSSNRHANCGSLSILIQYNAIQCWSLVSMVILKTVVFKVAVKTAVVRFILFYQGNVT